MTAIRYLAALASVAIAWAAWYALVSRVLERCEASLFQIDEPQQIVEGSFEVQRESGAHDSHTAHQFSTHVAHAPKTCSTRARSDAMRRLRRFRASEIGLLALPLR